MLIPCAPLHRMCACHNQTNAITIFFFFSLLSFAQFILCKISVALFFYLIFFKQATFLLLRKKKKKRKTITIHAPHSNAIFISKKKITNVLDIIFRTTFKNSMHKIVDFFYFLFDLFNCYKIS